MNITGKHSDRFRTPDSCRKGHGIGLSMCRICTPYDTEREIPGRHRAPGPASVGPIRNWPRG